MNQKFADFMRDYAGVPLAVAVSGGVDSVALLHQMVAAGADVTALHVNHGLRPAAGVEAAYVRDLCADLGVPCHVFEWAGVKPSRGLESAARDARYRMMTDFCRAHGIKYLFVAHQADDQIETFLMNLARGSGLDGLAAMRTMIVRDGITIVRPLLETPRAELIKYCDACGIKYFHDEMNDDAQYTRVRIRQNRHLLAEQLGIDDARILLAVRNLARARDAMDDIVRDRVENAMHGDHAMFPESFLFDVAPDIGLKFLGTLIWRIGGDLYRPRLDSLTRAMEQLRRDCKFTLGHCTVRRRGDRILIVQEGTSTSFRKRDEKTKKSI